MNNISAPGLAGLVTLLPTITDVVQFVTALGTLIVTSAAAHERLRKRFRNRSKGGAPAPDDESLSGGGGSAGPAR